MPENFHRLAIPPHPRGTVDNFEAKGHKITVRRAKGGSLRYTLDNERERTAAGLTSRYNRLYPPTSIEKCYADAARG